MQVQIISRGGRRLPCVAVACLVLLTIADEQGATQDMEIQAGRVTRVALTRLVR